MNLNSQETTGRKNHSPVEEERVSVEEHAHSSNSEQQEPNLHTRKDVLHSATENIHNEFNEATKKQTTSSSRHTPASLDSLKLSNKNTTEDPQREHVENKQKTQSNPGSSGKVDAATTPQNTVSSATTSTDANATKNFRLNSHEDDTTESDIAANAPLSNDRKSSTYERITKGESVENRETDVGKNEFMENLRKNGWEESISKDGQVTIFVKEGKRYSVRDKAKSTGGPTADYYQSGSSSIDVKIRLGGL